ncbi:hypothetical protein ABKN59_006615 [Abortiporus biennis]
MMNYNSELKHVPNSFIIVASILFGVLLSLLVLASWYYTPFSRTMGRDLPPTFGTPRSRRMPSSVLYRWTFPSTHLPSHRAGGIQATVNCHCEHNDYVTTAESSRPRCG